MNVRGSQRVRFEHHLRELPLFRICFADYLGVVRVRIDHFVIIQDVQSGPDCKFSCDLELAGEMASLGCVAQVNIGPG